MERIYNLDEASYILGVNKRTLVNWIRVGKLKVEWRRMKSTNELAPVYQIKESDLEACICNHTQKTISIINKYNSYKSRQNQLDYLDAKEDELYNDLCVIQQLKKQISRLEL